MGHGLELGFEVVGGGVAKGRVAAFGVTISNVVADFESVFGQNREATAIKLPRQLILCCAPWRVSKSLKRVAVYWLA